jgi:hypothetical protein
MVAPFSTSVGFTAEKKCFLSEQYSDTSFALLSSFSIHDPLITKEIDEAGASLSKPYPVMLRG